MKHSKILVILMFGFLSVAIQSCTSILKRVANRKYPPKFEATIKTESVKANFCSLKSFGQVDLALSLNTNEINQAMQAKMPEIREKLSKIKPFTPVKKITIDSIHIDSVSIYSEDQFIGLKTNAKIFFAQKSLIKYMSVEFDGGMTPYTRNDTVFLDPFLHSMKILKVKSKCFILRMSFIRNFVNKALAEIKDNINGAIPPIHYVIKIPVFPDKNFSSFLHQSHNLHVISDAQLKVDYSFLSPAILIDSNNLKVMTQVVDRSKKTKTAKCENIQNVQSMDDLIKMKPSIININTQSEMNKIMTTHFKTNYKRIRNSSEADSILAFQKLYAYYKFIYDTVRATYLTPDLSNENISSVGNISKDLIQRATTLVFSEATSFKLQYDLKGNKQIGPKEIKLLKNPDVDCKLFDYTCNLTFDCHKVLSPCNQDCKWSKPWNCAAKALCIGKNALAWSACQAINVPARGICLSEAIVKSNICAVEIVGKFLLYKFLTLGTINGNIDFSGSAVCNLESFHIPPDLSSVGLSVNYAAQARFDASIGLSNAGGLSYIICKFPPSFHDIQDVSSTSQAYKLNASIQTNMVNDTTLLDITTTEDPINIQFNGRFGKSPIENLILQNPIQFFFNCPVVLAALAVGTAALEVFGDDKLKSYVNAAYTGFYSQKIPGMKYQLRIRPIEIKTDFKEYSVLSKWTNKSVQFTLK